MAESFSVKAILSAKDANFSNAFKKAINSANQLKETVTSGFGFGIMMGAGQKAFSVISGGIGNMVSEMGFKKAINSANQLKETVTSGFGFGIMMGAGQKAFSVISGGIGNMVSEMGNASAAWKTFRGNMSMNGKPQAEIADIQSSLQKFAADTVYSASDMASTFAQLSAVGTKNTEKLVKGFGGLAAAAENPQQAMKTLSLRLQIYRVLCKNSLQILFILHPIWLLLLHSFLL